MKLFLLSIGVLAAMGSVTVEKGQLSDKVTLNVEVGSIEHAVDELSRASNVPMKVVGAAQKDTVYLHIEDRPVQEVLDHLALAVDGQWKLSADGTYVLSRDYAKATAEEKRQQAETLSQFETWKTQLAAGLDQPYDSVSLGKLMDEYRTITAHDNDEDKKEDSTPESESVQKRRDYFELCHPLARAMARCVAQLNLSHLGGMDQGGPIRFALHANSSQNPLPAGAVEAIAKVRNEYNAWISELKKHPAPKKEEGEDWTDLKPDDTPEAREDKIERLARMSPWQRLKPLANGSTNVTLTFERRYGERLICTMSLYGEKGELIASDSSSFSSFPDYYRDPKKKVKQDVSPSEETLALWTFYNQSEEYEEVKPQPFAIKAMEPYFHDPIANDPLRIGNQELLDSIADTKGKSVVACLPDPTFASYQESFSTEKFLKNDAKSDVKHQESDHWIDIYPADRREHWNQRLDRQSMANFSQEYRKTGKADMQGYVPLECGEFGYSAESELRSFLLNMMKRREWYSTPSEPSYNHLFLSLSSDQWQKIQRGEVIPYRDLSPQQLQLVSRIVYREFEFGYYGGKAPSSMAKRDPSFELPNGLLSGGGLGGEIVYDDVLVTHSNPPQPDEADDVRSGINLADRKETFKQIGFRCGMRSFIPMSSLFEFRKQKRYSLHVYLSAGHYYVGDFVEPLPASNGGRRYLYSELSPDMIKRINSHEQIMDISDDQSGTPPPTGY